MKAVGHGKTFEAYHALLKNNVLLHRMAIAYIFLIRTV